MQVVDAVRVAPEALAGLPAPQPHRRHLAPAAVHLDRPPGRCPHMLQAQMPCTRNNLVAKPVLLMLRMSSNRRLWPFLHA